MIGFYDYTVLLTYMSLISASFGIIITLSGKGHPYLGIFFLLFCGLCDAFDGKVARTKKNRSKMEQNFGIQIDSLSDLVAFGVLPACIGVALNRKSLIIKKFLCSLNNNIAIVIKYILLTILVLYILASLIRLAYFNVTEEERQKKETTTRKSYIGLPVTSASLIFPSLLLLGFIFKIDIAPLYYVTTLITGYLFLSKIQIKKPGLKGILIMVGIGAVEFLLLMLGIFCR